LRREFEETLHQMTQLQDNYTTITQEYDQLQATTRHDTMIKLYEGISGIRVMYRTILQSLEEQ
jgi:hypothetical protein